MKGTLLLFNVVSSRANEPVTFRGNLGCHVRLFVELSDDCSHPLTSSPIFFNGRLLTDFLNIRKGSESGGRLSRLYGGWDNVSQPYLVKSSLSWKKKNKKAVGAHQSFGWLTVRIIMVQWLICISSFP